jgi:5-methyltetrahydrofolate--homocysteine methyltransferase
MSTFSERLSDSRPLLYDGGFGSELFARGIELTNSALANESHPDAVVDIHRIYIEAGADIIGTNTFVASELHLDMAGKDPKAAGELVRQATVLARRAVDEAGKATFVAGSIGPSPGAIESDAGSTDFGIADIKVRQAHERVIEGLVEGGVDFFVLETMFSANEAAIACDIARRAGLPIIINLTLKYTKDRKSGEVVYKTDWGHSSADLLDILASGRFSDGENLLPYVQVFGLNCGAENRRTEHTGMPYAIHGTDQLQRALRERGLEQKIMAYPNAGMPQLNSAHRTVYTQSPTEMAGHVPQLIDTGAYIIGGCCGTNPDHIRAIRRVIDTHIQ